MKILQVCAYSPVNPGNFIASLAALETKAAELGYETIYAFPDRARNTDWCKEISKRTNVYYLSVPRGSVRPSNYYIFRKIFRQNPDIAIVHSHFELYDVPVTVMAPRKVKIFWHLHDAIQTKGDGIRSFFYKFQYGIFGRRATLISVSRKYRDDVCCLGFQREHTYVVLNGIQFDRLSGALEEKKTVIYDFLTFGWDFYGKGDDIIIKACNRLADDGYSFKLLLNGNEHTWPVLRDFLAGQSLPSYIETGNPVNDVSELFEHSSVFILASRRETFSYSICEAAFSGLPVISSDIAGVEWAHQLPSVAFFPSEDEISLSLRMKEFLDGKVVADSILRKSKEIIQEKFSVDSWVDKILNIYLNG